MSAFARDPGPAVDHLRATLGEDPFDWITQLEEAGKRKAEATALAYRLEHERKPLLSRIGAEIAAANPKAGSSETKLERLARADPRYARHIEGTAEAIRAREAAASEYWAIQTRLTWLERAIGHENALIRLDGRT